MAVYARLGKQVLPTMSSTEIEAIHTYVLHVACGQNGVCAMIHALWKEY
jgi:hypothetical protein